MVYWKTLNLYRKFQFIGNFKATQYFVTIVGPHFQWLEFHITSHGMTGKQCAFSAQMAGKKLLSLRLLAGISTLAQWTAYLTPSGICSPDYRLIACESYIPLLHSVIVTVFQSADSLILLRRWQYPCFISHALLLSFFVKMVREWHEKDNISTGFPASMVVPQCCFYAPCNALVKAHPTQPPPPTTSTQLMGV